MQSSRAVAACLVALALPLSACGSGADTTGANATGETARVTYVFDGDTLEVRMSDSGKREKVRVLGVDTPERGFCQYEQATAATRSLATGKTVTLTRDDTQDARDRFGRLLAYVTLPDGRDLGLELVADGHARVYVYNGHPFSRVRAYKDAQSGAHGHGIWTCPGDPSRRSS